MVDLQTQLRQFAELQGAVTAKHGEIYANKLFSNAVYIVSVGSNDYLGGYLGNPAQQQKYTPEQFVGLVVQGVAEALQVPPVLLHSNSQAMVKPLKDFSSHAQLLEVFYVELGILQDT